MAESQDIEKVPYESVQQNDHESSLTPPPTPKQRTKFEKLGLYNVSVLIIGTLVIFMAMGFLGFVWIVSVTTSTEGIPYLWYLIVWNDWTSRVVTLATMLVRLAVAAQLCVFAALMAALILERAGTSTEDLPLLSMIRCANTGPQALIWNIIHTIPKGIQLGYSFIIITTILNALALQFMSTLLLADFSSSWVLSSARTNVTDASSPNSVRDRVYPIQYAIEDLKESRGSGYTSITGSNSWQSGSSTFPSFAEYKKDPSAGAAFQDTGLTYRGFLPFNNASLRRSLMTYHGPVTVVDERVVCVKPQLGNLTLEVNWTRNVLSGDININNTHPDVFQAEENSSFNCPMPSLSTRRGNFWQLSLCELSIAGLKNSIRPVEINYDSQTGENITFETATVSTFGWLFLNVTTADGLNYTGGSSGDDSPETIRVPLSQIETPRGPWARANSTNVTIDASYCVMKPVTDVYIATIESTWDTTSGDGHLYWNASKYDTTEVRMMFNALGPAETATRKSGDAPGMLKNEDRGILGLTPVADWNATRAAVRYNTSYSESLSWMLMSLLKTSNSDNPQKDIAPGFLLIPDEEGSTIHRSLLWVALDILSNTRNPALALQSLLHCVMSNTYYDLYNSFDLKTNEPIYTEVESCYVPTQSKHFYVVLGLLGLHAVFILIALVLFLTRTEMSLLGNSWQAVAQVMSSDTAEAMHHGSTATDNEVIHAVRDQRIRLARSEQSGRLEAIAVSRRT
ncbi:hypothetical protein FB567DRAFT_522731 [Paraphoma chrysanthemicola]|uniref:Uncharacterized protein n=1 Tax=Paraphoma chrysanthemicola TaxID=798071 RepID=A0A8K0R6U4_9PLEO|nr:hypothetical protein FB567DRAFT_522731 [Paraphoma chrysanthemicola]